MADSKYATLLQNKIPKLVGETKVAIGIAVFSLMLTSILFGTLAFRTWETPHGMVLVKNEMASLQYRIDQQSERIYRLQKEVAFLQSRQKAAEAREDSLRRNGAISSSVSFTELEDLNNGPLPAAAWQTEPVSIDELPMAPPNKKRGNKV